jgi:hypothetical protein
LLIPTLARICLPCERRETSRLATSLAPNVFALNFKPAKRASRRSERTPPIAAADRSIGSSRRTFEDPIDIAGRGAALVEVIRPVGDQATGRDEGAFVIDCGQLVLGRERDDQGYDEASPTGSRSRSAHYSCLLGRVPLPDPSCTLERIPGRPPPRASLAR